MLFHATITSFRKDAQSPFSALRRVFTRPTRKVNVFNKLLGSRAYGVKTAHPPSPNGDLSRKGHHGEQMPVPTNLNTQKDERKKSRDVSSLPDETNLPRRSGYLHRRNTTLGSTKAALRPQFTIPTIPSTKWELYQEILRLISLTPAATFSRLMSIHQRHPTLQSVESYNLLLQLSIRHSFTRHTQVLIKSMAINRIEPNYNTEKLVVRHLVTSGNWKQAWQQTVTRYPSVADIPMPVLLELLAPGTRNFPRPQVLGSRQLSLKSASGSQLVDESYLEGRTALKIPLDALVIILHRFPLLSLNELARLPARVISYVVRGLIRNGHHNEAIELTENHLKTLPTKISPRQIDFARGLVHLHLSWGKVKLANYKKRRRLVERLFSLHSSLRPNSQTVSLLMRYMKSSKRCGVEAYQFYKDYRSRWGAAVDSLDVRRRVIRYAIKQRKLGIAKEIALEAPLEDPLLQHQEAVQGRSDPLWRVRAWRTMYPRKGRGSRLWKRILIRLLGRRRGWRRRRTKGRR